jgi:hypothetical protein
MESLPQNKQLFYGLITSAIFLVIIILQLLPELSWLLELSPLPIDFRLLILGIVIGDFFLCWIWEALVVIVLG